MIACHTTAQVDTPSLLLLPSPSPLTPPSAAAGSMTSSAGTSRGARGCRGQGKGCGGFAGVQGKTKSDTDAGK